MIKMWDDVKFEFSEFKNNMYIVKSYDDVIAIVD